MGKRWVQNPEFESGRSHGQSLSLDLDDHLDLRRAFFISSPQSKVSATDTSVNLANISHRNSSGI